MKSAFKTAGAANKLLKETDEEKEKAKKKKPSWRERQALMKSKIPDDKPVKSKAKKTVKKAKKK